MRKRTIEYRIMGKYSGNPLEEIDSFPTRSEARNMLAEYRMSFGAGWSLSIKRGYAFTEE